MMREGLVKFSACLEPVTSSLLLAVYVKTHFLLTSPMIVKSQWPSLDIFLSLHNCLEKKCIYFFSVQVVTFVPFLVLL